MLSLRRSRSARPQHLTRRRATVRPTLEELETRALLSPLGQPQSPLPTKTGEVFVIDDFNNKVTRTDLGFNYFGGNTGATESAPGITTVALSPESNGPAGGSLRLSFDFTGQAPEGPFAGYFASLFGLTDTKVSLDSMNGMAQDPPTTTHFPGYFLDTRDLFRDFLPLPDRSLEDLRFDVRLLSSSQVTLKVELKDESGFDVFTRRTVSGPAWQTVSLSLANDFTDSVSGNGNTTPFDWRRVSVLSLIVERQNVGAGVTNPTTGAFLVDNIAVADRDGVYPDPAAAYDPATGSILPQYTEAFLDHVRATSFLYFLDFASTDPRTGGIVQDRSTFADLMTTGGAGFQLTAYAVGAEQGYISRPEAAARARNVLRALHDGPQGPGRVGTTGYQGFFYHFLGIDGLRKQNFDFRDTADVNEALNTVELSTIDTALAVAGALTARQYFDGPSADEVELRTLADDIYARVNWRFMLYQNPGAPQDNQFYLGWKPTENRDDVSGRYGRFRLDDANGLGQYSSKVGANGGERPATLDFYTDEGLLIALLAAASPDPQHRVDDAAFYAMARQGQPFVKTFPGALFTYQFGSVWLDTDALGPDAHPTRPIDYFENTRSAILTTRQYAIDNPNDRATWRNGGGATRWGLSAAEGPFDDYAAAAAPPAALATDGGLCVASGGPVALEGEAGGGDGSVMSRGAASGGQTVHLNAGETRRLPFTLGGTSSYQVSVRYSNDNFGPLETVQVSIDGAPVGSFMAQDTGDFGFGWNNFLSSGPIGSRTLASGPHELTVSVSGGDGFGVEIDLVSLDPQQGQPLLRPLETGTVTVYGAGSSIVHAPAEAIAALAESQRLGLLHPRFGFADAFNLDIADAVVPGCVDPNDPRVLRATGPWANFTGFAIDHGPMLALIDNYLEHQSIPRRFMSYPTVRDALTRLFPSLPTLRFESSQVPVGEANGTAMITVTRTGDLSAQVTVNYATSDGTAIAGRDYYPASGQLVFDRNVVSRQFPVTLLDDGRLEGNETINLLLSSPSGGPILGSPSSAQLVISDDDQDLVSADPTLTADRSFVRALYADFLGRPGALTELGSWVSELRQLRQLRQSGEGMGADWIALVNVLYLRFLGRSATGDPGAAGWAEQLRSGQTEARVSAAILASDEFANRADTLIGQKDAHGNLLRDDNFVRALYQVLFNRLPADTEVAGWKAESSPTFRADLATFFVNSPEYRASAARRSEEDIATQIIRSPEAIRRLVKSWYAFFLGRSQQPTDDEVQGWVNPLVAGATVERILPAILASPEFDAHAPTVPGVSGGAATDQTFVSALYSLLLGRAASQADIQFWVGRVPVLGRDGVAAGFLDSAEYRGGAVRTFYGDTTFTPLPYQPFFPNLLRRGARVAATEVDGWVNSGKHLLGIEVGFAASPEFFNNG
jgi:hypothetical protein